MPPGGLNIRHEIDHARPGGAAARIQARRRRRLHPRQRAEPHRLFRRRATPKIGIITVGKSYLDVRQALDDIGIDEARANQIGIRLFKVGCPWPLDIEHIADFARGLETVIVVEEKRSLIEVQVQRGRSTAPRSQPVVVGKKDERGDWLFPAKGALDPNDIAIALGERMLRTIGPSEEIAAQVSAAEAVPGDARRHARTSASRTPFFCSGCPHNSLDQGAGGLDRRRRHRLPFHGAVDGPRDHRLHRRWAARARSGSARRRSRSASTSSRISATAPTTIPAAWRCASRSPSSANITYKILFNDAVAMTGGQPHEGSLTVDMIASQVRAEGVERIAIVTDEPDKYAGRRPVSRPAPPFHHRDDLDLVQRELRDVQGRLGAALRPDLRGRKAPPPQARHLPGPRQARHHQRTGLRGLRRLRRQVELRLGPAGRDRIRPQAPHRPVELQQGFLLRQRLLPVLRHGAWRQDPQGRGHGRRRPIRSPACRSRRSFRSTATAGPAIIDGVGGTGVVTIGAVLGMAAHLEGKGCGMIDMAGLAQKGGAVFTHVRIARTPEDIHAIRVSAGKADLVLGCDLVVSGAKKVLAAVREGHTIFVANTAEIMPGEFTRSADFSLPVERLKRAIRAAAGEEQGAFLRRHAHRHGAVRQFARRQHVHARLRLPAWRPAAVGGGRREGHRAQRRGGGDEHRGLPLGPPRRATSRSSCATCVAGQAPTAPQLVADARRHHRQARRLPDRLPERRLCASAIADRVAAIRSAEDEAAPGSTLVARGRRAQPVQADGDQGRIRGGPALHRRLLRAAVVGDSSRAATGWSSTWRRRSWAARAPTASRASRRFGPLDDEGLPRAGGAEAACAARRSTSSATRPSDAWSARCWRSTRPISTLIAQSLAPDTIDAAAALASVPALIRGYGHVKQASADKAAGERDRLLDRLTAIAGKAGSPGGRIEDAPCSAAAFLGFAWRCVRQSACRRAGAF